MKKSKIKVIPQTEEYGYDLYDDRTNGSLPLIEKFLQPQSIVFDIGSFPGTWALEVLNKEPNATVYCFEHQVFNYKLLQNLLACYPNAKAHLTSPLDEFCMSANLTGINILRVNAQALAVLPSARELLSKQKIACIQFSYSQSLSFGQMALKDLMQLLATSNYTIFRIFPFGLIHMSHWKDWLDSPKYCTYFAIQRSSISQCDPMIFP